MAIDEQISILDQGVLAWNQWRAQNLDVRVDLSALNLDYADFSGADFRDANLKGANLRSAQLEGADLEGADLSEADLTDANLNEADAGADYIGANLSGASFICANLPKADFTNANLSETIFLEANLRLAVFRGANLRGANLTSANLMLADLSGTNISNSILAGANLLSADLSGANISGCSIYGVSAWDLTLENTKQEDLVITPDGEAAITVDNIEVAQFVYLLLHNEKIRGIVDTIGWKGVLLLGRFTEGRIMILERLRAKLRALGFVPIVFNFDKPETKGFTETTRLLCNLSHFVIVDISNPRSAPLELQATIPNYMVPFVPILEKGEQPFSMFVDLQTQYDWVLRPVLEYSSVDRLIELLEDKVVRPAEAKFNELLTRRAEQMRIEKI